MDVMNLISNIYKQQLAEANEQKILFQAQCEIYKAKIEQLEQQLKEKNEEIFKMKADEAAKCEAVVEE